MNIKRITHKEKNYQIQILKTHVQIFEYEDIPTKSFWGDVIEQDLNTREFHDIDRDTWNAIVLECGWNFSKAKSWRDAWERARI